MFMGGETLVSRCLRCAEFKEREEMESRTTEEYPIVTMCISCWKQVDDQRPALHPPTAC